MQAALDCRIWFAWLQTSASCRSALSDRAFDTFHSTTTTTNDRDDCLAPQDHRAGRARDGGLRLLRPTEGGRRLGRISPAYARRVAAILVLSALCATLLFEHRRRRRAEIRVAPVLVNDGGSRSSRRDGSADSVARTRAPSAAERNPSQRRSRGHAARCRCAG